MRAPVRIFLASSNPGKLAEYRVLATTCEPSCAIELELLPGFAAIPEYEEDAPTFAENAAAKVLYYSKHADGWVFADDSGLVVPALGGAPGVHSARYAGPDTTNVQKVEKLLGAMQGKTGVERSAHFVCAIALAQSGRAKAIVTDRVDGEILQVPQGSSGFGYDPVFYFPALRKTFAEIPEEEKNRISHRGKAFRRLLAALSSML